MDTLRLQQVAELFEAARHQPDDSREMYLRAACPDESLRAEVASLLQHHHDDAAPLNEPLLGDTNAAAALMEIDEQRALPLKQPATIGRYRVLSVLGEGGMGAVYLAEQDQPRRTVALKVIRSGLTTRRMLRRFEFEAAVLGMLNHAGIAQIYDAGVHDDGTGLRPFFAMEFVHGDALTTFARKHNLGTRQRLELVAKVCDAVQHAHQRGVIHRDLKPSNILVDDTGQPKVLDFGVARATDSDIQVTTLQTDVGQLVGTLPYMSPEQVSGDATRLDTRSDVYSLGVILYELLSGRLPHDVRGKTIAEAARMIGEEDPAPLSSIDRVFRGDLQTIVGRALDKDKDHRYASASEVAEDIRHFLRDEPIDAKRDSMSYILRKRLRRYRLAVAAAAMILVGITAFATYAAIQARAQTLLASKERDARSAAEEFGRRAVLAEMTAQQQRDEAQRARDAEQQRSAQAQSVTAFLVNTLGMTNPDVSQTPDMTKEMMLAKASAEIAGAFPAQPEAEATVRAVIGKAYAALGQSEPAAHHLWRALRLRRSLEQRDMAAEYDVFWPYVQVLGDMQDPSRMRQRDELEAMAVDLVSARLPQARSLLVEIQQNVKTATNRQTVERNFGRLIELATAELDPDDPAWTPLADFMHLSAPAIRRREIPDVAHSALVFALGTHRRMLGETNTRVVRLLSDLLDDTLLAGNADEASAFADQSLEALRQILPEDHWYVAEIRFRLGECRAAQGRHAEAEALMTESLPIIVESRGLGSDQANACLRSMLRFYDDGQHPNELARQRLQFAETRAASIQASSIALLGEMLGPDLENLKTVTRALQNAVTRQESDLDASLDAMLAAWRDALPEDDPRFAFVADFLTGMAIRRVNTLGLDSMNVVTQMLQESVAIDSAVKTRHPRRQASTRWWLARFSEMQGQYIEGERWARETLRLLEGGPVERYGLIANAQSVLGGCLVGQGQYEEAEPNLLDGYIGLRDEVGPADSDAVLALARLIHLYEAWDRDDQATKWREVTWDMNTDHAMWHLGNVNRATWQVAVQPNRPIESYRLALAAAEIAMRQAPQSSEYVNTLGVVQYRAGRFAEALETLKRSEAAAAGIQYEDLAFLALTHYALGNAEAARAARQRLSLLAGEVDARQRAEYDAIVLEVDSRLNAGATAATP